QRRVEVGPVATFYFENFATMWQQVQEMLYIEKGGEAQIADELAAYNPLIPQGSELVATVMFEIDDPRRRATTLARLGGIENCAFVDVAGDKVRGEPDPTRENTDPDGKASAVQFIRFSFTPQQIAAFKKPGSQIVIGFDHPNYSHMAVMPKLPAMAADLVERGAAVIGAFGPPAVIAAKAGAPAVPIVFVTGADPIKFGFVESFNRPGGNLTGVWLVTTVLAQKRLELLREMVPRAGTIAFLLNPQNPPSAQQARDAQTA